jgi:hypothetical protein
MPEDNTPTVLAVRKPRPFGRKVWAYLKQSNPPLNTWRYYMRLEPRWTRATLIYLSLQANLLSTFLLKKYQAGPLIRPLIVSLLTYVFVLHGLTRLLTVKPISDY